MKIQIKENSFRAKIAAHYLKEKSIAIVFGNKICLYNTSKEDFLKDKKWVRHEVQHVYQYKKSGYFNFIFQYLIECFKNGYESNRFEIEAREKENDIDMMKDIDFIR